MRRSPKEPCHEQRAQQAGADGQASTRRTKRIEHFGNVEGSHNPVLLVAETSRNLPDEPRPRVDLGQFTSILVGFIARDQKDPLRHSVLTGRAFGQSIRNP
jgi:hypothetical protein